MSTTDIQRHRLGPDKPDRMRDAEPTYSELMDQAIGMAERNIIYGEGFYQMRRLINRLITDLRAERIDPFDEDGQERINEYDCEFAQVFARIYAQ